MRFISKTNNKNIRFRKKITLTYFLIIIMGALILYSPLTTIANNSVSMIDAFFISASSLSDTGLMPIVTIDYFNSFGHFIILILTQLGGLGFMTIKIFLLLIIGRKISTSDRMMFYTQQHYTSTGGLVKQVKDVFTIIIILQTIFTIIIAIHLMLFYNYDFFNALWFGFFHSTSSINNGGVDLTGNSFINFNKDYLFQTYIMFLVIIGGLGFPVILDIKNYILNFKEKKRFKFSLFSKISLITYAIVTIIGFISMLISERAFVENSSGLDSFFTIMFHVISSRSAGFYTVDITNFTSSTHFILSLLMFIGPAPASTGGGIRTTTFAIIFLFLRAYISNKKDTEVFNRRITKEAIFSSLLTFTLAVFIIGISTLFLVIFDSDTSIIKAFFEVCSGFGTTGFTLNYTPDLAFLSKILMAFVMVVGQIGIVNVLIIFTKNKEDTNLIRYPEETIIVG